jgi:hypothetical protein
MSLRDYQTGHKMQTIGPTVFVELVALPKYFVVNQGLVRVRPACRLSQQRCEKLVACGKAAVKVSRLISTIITYRSARSGPIGDVLEVVGCRFRLTQTTQGVRRVRPHRRLNRRCVNRIYGPGVLGVTGHGNASRWL